MDWNELPALFPSFGQPDRWLPLLQRHAALLEEASSHTRVTSVAPEEAIQRHFAESLEIWRICRESGPVTIDLVVDVGSGGGFPGLVMACVSPETRFALVEPLQKRARLLVSMSEELGLTNVEVSALRAEEAGRGPLRGRADVVTARAVAPMSELLEYTVPFLRLSGIAALPKGSALQAELESSGRAMSTLGCLFLETVSMRAEISETLSLAVFHKDRETPKTYPRKPGTPRLRPL